MKIPCQLGYVCLHHLRHYRLPGGSIGRCTLFLSSFRSAGSRHPTLLASVLPFAVCRPGDWPRPKLLSDEKRRSSESSALESGPRAMCKLPAFLDGAQHQRQCSPMRRCARQNPPPQQTLWTLGVNAMSASRGRPMAGAFAGGPEGLTAVCLRYADYLERHLSR